MTEIDEDKLIKEFKGVDLDMPSEKCTYNTSWDMLMPIVEKIESLDLSDWYDEGNFESVSVDMEKGNCYVYVNLTYDPAIRISGITNFDLPKIELVYTQVLEFIKWYNENKPK